MLENKVLNFIVLPHQMKLKFLAHIELTITHLLSGVNDGSGTCQSKGKWEEATF